MKTWKKLLIVLTVLLLTAAVAMAEGLNDSDVSSGRFVQGMYAAESNGYVYFVVNTTGGASLYRVPSAGGDIELLETDSTITGVAAAGSNVFYIRKVGASAQLVRRTDYETEVLQLFAQGSKDVSLGYYDGMLYVVHDGRLFAFDAVTGIETAINEEPIQEYCIQGDRIYFVSAEDLRTYTRTYTDSKQNISVTGGCLYSMALDGSDVRLVLEVGVSDLRGYGEYIYFHNYSDNYFVASSSGDDKWLDGKLYRYSIVTGLMSRVYDSYDWDYYPCAYGVLLYTSQALNLFMPETQESVLLMNPEVYTSVAANSEFAYIYEHTDQIMTKVPLNGEVPIVLGAGLGDTAAEGEKKQPASGDYQVTQETVLGNDAYIFPESSERKLTEEDLTKVDPRLWSFGRNEIYAKHGYEFRKAEYAKYFKSKSWYKAGGFSTKNLNDFERYNMDLIKKYEDRYADKIAAMLKGKYIPEEEQPVDTEPETEPVRKQDSEYIFPDSDKRLLTKAEILELDRSLWGFARNEIYARHGYEFRKAEYIKYFKSKSWYKAGGFSTKSLNDIEWANMDLIKKMESQY